MFRRAAYGRHWSAGDDERLLKLADAGQSDQEIALALGRSRGSVAERRGYLRLVGAS
ncbi:MAG TPA: hypothetical protein VE567_07770 [Sphingomonas sp.]|nr:hypothetical protein [Sphingomonas sp.]